MFNFLIKPIIGTLAVLVLSLGGWSWYQGQKIDSLKAENQAQAQTISQMERVQHQLKTALDEERQAVKFQQKIAHQMKAEMESKREKVKTIFKSSPCANTALPDGVIEQLR